LYSADPDSGDFVADSNGSRLFPGLAYPSLSPAGDFLAAERYLPSDISYPNPADAQLWGVIVARAAERLGVDAAAGIIAQLGSLLDGGSGPVAHFKLAQRSEELRAAFGAGRAAVEAEAQAHWPSEPIYDASAAERYCAALLLESLAAIQTQRVYAAGVAATYALPDPASLITWPTGQDWRAAVEELQVTADGWELMAETGPGDGR
jgi:hypothetical protein